MPTILTYDAIIKVAVGSSDEPLVDVRAYDSSIIAQYDKYDMVPYTGTTIFVRQTLARKLARVNAFINDAYGLNLKVVYGYRHPAVQRRYFEASKTRLGQQYPDLDDAALTQLTHGFVAIPEVAGHPVGGAIDLTLVTLAGEECDMGTRIADFSDAEKIKTFAAGLTGAQKKLRQLLHDAMMRENFAPFYGEWWHFSHGDREWAAFYKRPASLYAPVTFTTALLITAANGNGTAIQIVDTPLTRSQYETFGKELGRIMEPAGAEQSGFLLPATSHFEMAGGEFCGNASRAAAILLAELSGQTTVDFTVSGFDGTVYATVAQKTAGEYDVSCRFVGMRVVAKEASLMNGGKITVVDLGGIVHVVVDAPFPVDEAAYTAAHQQIVSKLSLADRDAVGVIWMKMSGTSVSINPVVWVRAIDTFFYESACASGSVAVAHVSKQSNIIQPAGGTITVAIAQDGVTIAGRMQRIQ